MSRPVIPEKKLKYINTVFCAQKRVSDWLREWCEFLHQSQNEIKQNNDLIISLSTINQVQLQTFTWLKSKIVFVERSF